MDLAPGCLPNRDDVNILETPKITLSILRELISLEIHPQTAMGNLFNKFFRCVCMWGVFGDNIL